MPRFIATDNGQINLDLIAIVTSRRSDRTRGLLIFSFVDDEGHTLGTLESDHLDLERLCAPVVPADGSIGAYIVGVGNGSGARPTAADVVIVPVPVLAWRVVRDAAEPVMLELPCEGERILLGLPDGSVLEPDIAHYRDLAHAQTAILEEAQSFFDMKARVA